MNDKKEKIIEELKEYGWEYVIDYITPQGRYHFERYFEIDFEENGCLAEIDYVLIFDYSLEELHFQDCRKFGEKEIIEPQRHKTLYGADKTLDSVALTIEELELFLQFMYILREEYKQYQEVENYENL